MNTLTQEQKDTFWPAIPKATSFFAQQEGSDKA